MSIIQALIYSNPSTLEISGGQKYVPGNGYAYHVFLEPGFFDVFNGPLTIETLIVAGGGSGGYSPTIGAGGGGSGGVRNITSIILNDGFYPIVVGSGGLSPGTSMSAGSPSSAFGYESAGGGRGNGIPSDISSANSGGSGGGNSSAPPSGSRPLSGTGNTPQVSPPQGNPGGIGLGPGSSGSAGGGGGKGSSGSNASPASSYYQGGPGGAGAPYPEFAAPLFPGMPPDWISAVGPTGLYGGGGGGGSGPHPTSASQSPASGGSGGGGRGYTYRPTTPPNTIASPSTPGIDYTGGGGGGGKESNLRSGGKGIVIIRYAV